MSRAASGPRRVSGIRSVFVLLGAAAATPALALSLGGITEQSMLGEPLRAVIPVSSLSGEEMSIDCVKIAPSSAPSRDEVPEVSSAAITLEQAGGQTRLVVSTRRPVNDPAVRLTLQLECPETVRREYLMLLDPPAPSAATPVLEASAAPPVPTNVATLSRPPESTPAATISVPAEAGPGAVNTQQGRTQPKEPSIGAAVPAGRSPSPNAAPGKPRRSESTRSESPRLAVSRSVPAADAGRGPGLERMSKSAQLAAVEEEEVVLRKRVEELQLMVERMQQERIMILAAEVERLQSELRASESARRAAENAVRTSPLHAVAQWSTDSWPLILGALAAVGLTGAGVFAWRHRKQRQAPLPAEPPLMGNPDTGLVDTYLDEMSQFPRSFRPAVQAPAVHPLGADGSQAPHEQEFERDVEGAGRGTRVDANAGSTAAESAGEQTSNSGSQARTRLA